jgi:hypothetical protein
MAESADQQLVLEVIGKINDVVDKFTKDLPAAIARGFQSATKIAQDGADGLEKTVADVGDKMKDHGEDAGRSYAQGFQLAFAAGAAEFLNTMRETIDRASEYATQLSTTSMITGDSPKKLQELEYVMRGVGVSAEQTQRQMGQLQSRVVAAAAKATDTTSVFYRLGLSAKEMASKGAVEQLEMLSDKVRNLKTSADQTAAAALIFGVRLGPQMLPVLLAGSAGMEKMGKSADDAGAVIDTNLIEKLEKLDGKLKQLQQTTQTFYVTLGEPIIDALQNFADALSRVHAAFEKMSDQSKLLLLIGALGASFLAFEKGLETVGFFMRGMITKELFDFLVDLAGPIRILVAIISVLATAWVTNFGNIKAAVGSLWDSVEVFWANAIRAFSELRSYAEDVLTPAISNLSKAFGPLFAAIGGLIGLVLRNNGLWDIFVGIAKFVIDSLRNMLVALTDVAQLITALIQGVAGLGALFIEAFGQASSAISQAESSLAKFLVTLGSAADKIPHIGKAIGSAFRGASQVVLDDSKRSAADAKVSHQSALNLLNAVSGKNAPSSGRAATAKGEEEKPHGDAHLKPPITSKPKHEAGEFLDDEKEKLRGLQLELAKSEAELAHLTSQFANLGKIDTPQKVAAAQANLTKQIAEHNQQSMIQNELAAKYDQIQRETRAKMASAATPQDARKYRDAAEADAKAAVEARGKSYKDIADRAKLEQQRTHIPVQYQEDVAGDTLKTDEQRDKANNQALYLLSLQKQSIERDNEMAKIEAERIALNSKITDERSKQAGLKLTGQQDVISRQIEARDTQVIGGPGKGQAEQQRAIADATDQVRIANLKMVASADELAAAQEQLTYVQQHAHTNDQLIAAQDKEAAAAQAVATAQGNAAISQQKLTNLQMQQSQSSSAVNNALVGLAQQIAGPLVDAFKLVTEQAVNPLVAIFITLISQTRSFQDIMNVFAQIMRVIAAILDAFRPVIDLLLGILIGVVDVFIALYNVVRMVLSLFGIQLVKLQALTDSLGALDTTVKPLVQVVHDLPTINQYNAGVTGDLSIPQQDSPLVPAIENNTQSLLKLGTVLGTLIGIFVAGNFISNIGGFFQGLQKIGSDISNFWDNVTSQWSSGMKTGVDDFVTGFAEIVAGLDLINNHTGGILGFLEKLVGYLSVFEGSVNVINGLSNMFGGGDLIKGIPGSGGAMSWLQKLTGGGGSSLGAPDLTDNNGQSIPTNFGYPGSPSFNNQPIPVNIVQQTATNNLPGTNSPLPDFSSTDTKLGTLNSTVDQNSGSLNSLNTGIAQNTSGLDVSNINIGDNTSSLDLNNIGMDANTTATNAVSTSNSTLNASVTGNTNASSGLSSSISSLGKSITGFMTGAGIGAAAGSIFSKLVGGNQANAELGSTIGGGVGDILSIGGKALGPLGALGGALVGSLIGSMFGPHYNQKDNPDMYADDGYAQAMANYQSVSNTQANGQVTEQSDVSQALGGQNEAHFLSNFIAQNPQLAAQLLTPTEVSLFSGNDDVTGLHQGTQTLANGQSLNWSDLFNNVNDAMTKISTYAQNAQMNLSQTYGDGSTVTSGGTRTTMGANASGQAQIVVNIGTLNGDAGATTDTMTQVMNDAYAQFAQAQSQAMRSNTFTYSQFV